MANQEVVIKLSSFYAKILVGVMVALIVSTMMGAFGMWDRLARIEQTVSNHTSLLQDTPRYRDLNNLELLNDQRYQEILRRLRRIEKKQDGQL